MEQATVTDDIVAVTLDPELEKLAQAYDDAKASGNREQIKATWEALHDAVNNGVTKSIDAAKQRASKLPVEISKLDDLLDGLEDPRKAISAIMQTVQTISGVKGPYELVTIVQSLDSTRVLATHGMPDDILAAILKQALAATSQGPSRLVGVDRSKAENAQETEDKTAEPVDADAA